MVIASDLSTIYDPTYQFTDGSLAQLLANWPKLGELVTSTKLQIDE